MAWGYNIRKKKRLGYEPNTNPKGCFFKYPSFQCFGFLIFRKQWYVVGDTKIRATQSAWAKELLLGCLLRFPKRSAYWERPTDHILRLMGIAQYDLQYSRNPCPSQVAMCCNVWNIHKKSIPRGPRDAKGLEEVSTCFIPRESVPFFSNGFSVCVFIFWHLSTLQDLLGHIFLVLGCHILSRLGLDGATWDLCFGTSWDSSDVDIPSLLHCYILNLIGCCFVKIWVCNIMIQHVTTQKKHLGFSQS